METIADRINEILKIKGIKKTEFAKRIGISDSSVSTCVLASQSRADKRLQ